MAVVRKIGTGYAGKASTPVGQSRDVSKPARQPAAPAPRMAIVAEQLGVSIRPANRVLIVDDEEENLAVLEGLLRRQCKVLLASTAGQAYDLVGSRCDVDVVIADHRMPGVQGLDLLVDLGRRFPGLKRIILTAVADKRPFLKAVDNGEIDVLMDKPYSAGELRTLVRQTTEAQTAWRLLDALLAPLSGARTSAWDLCERIRNIALVIDMADTLIPWMQAAATKIAGCHVAMGQIRASADANTDDPELTAFIDQAEKWLARLQLHAQLALAAAKPQRTNLVTANPVASDEFMAKVVSGFAADPAGRDRTLRITQDGVPAQLHLHPTVTYEAVLTMLRKVAWLLPKDRHISLELRREGQADLNIRVHAPQIGGARGDRPRPAQQEAPVVAPDCRFHLQELATMLGLELMRVGVSAAGARLEAATRSSDPTAPQLHLPYAIPKTIAGYEA